MSEPPVIRTLRETDLPAILGIENLAFSPPWPEEAFRHTEFTQSWVISTDGDLRGYIIYHVVPDEAVIVNFAIAPDFWCHGLGSLLLQHSLDIMQESGINAVYLDVRRSNLAALKLYNKYGFKPLGVRKNYYSKPREDALVMVRYNNG